CHDGSRCSSTGPEIAEGERLGSRLTPQPVRSARQSASKQLNIEDIIAILGFFFFKQVEEQGGQTHVLEPAGDILIAWAETPAAATVGEHDHSLDRLRHM